MGQQSMVGLVRGAYRRGCGLWQGHHLICHQHLSPKPYLCYSSHPTIEDMASSCSPSVHERFQNGESYRSRVMETIHGDVLTIEKPIKGRGSFNGGQFINKNTTRDCLFSSHHGGDISYRPKLFNTLGKALSSIMLSGAALSPNSTSSSSWAGGRSFSTSENYEPLSSLKLGSSVNPALITPSPSTAMDFSEAEADTISSESVEDFDFRNFPALKSSFYQDYERPSVMMRRKKPMVLQISRNPFDAENKLTLESIPQPKGPTYDFGLEDTPTKPPPLEAGARPQGVFDIDISLNKCEEVPFESLSDSVLPRLDDPYDTPKADWSEISCVSEAEQDLWWDPYDLDAHVELPCKSKTQERL